MVIKLERFEKTNYSTMGKLFMPTGEMFFTCEDTDRGLDKSMPLKTIWEKKVKGKTAIPTGTYEIIVSYSNKFKKYLPLLLNVPGYQGIRIHPGNTHADTEGCILPGISKLGDSIRQSKTAYWIIFDKIAEAVVTDKIYISIY
ncbi:MAG: DUF5675 family protein [Chitinophagaceae bacterium]